ncbi:hypothetical protein ASPZODRAFT_1536236 [Penicilliopsis zonata CBS 506.65]|uniref:Transcription factor domain-containing protein n=1 Tax=Penicilliopsis zonata CBS 506.65 TaxID=1073090 RepID=A0A1L9SLW0_9EURO|nr:hypothetical protein ASPZODRAFT_1536236 [Penicilliopsis zonata CBS 506.65]OJJ48180.1 hypothetical protein ASPZODRAFT_1536236 [Penicilliopsis zonata CBS 506.65]
MTDGPPCVRCRRRSLSCVLNKSLQSLVEEVKNTELLQTDIRSIHETLEAICRHLNLHRPKPLVSTADTDRAEEHEDGHSDNERDQHDLSGCEVSPPDTPSAVQAPIHTFLDIAKLGSPGSSENTPPSAARPRRRSIVPQDLVSKGVISLAVAEILVDRYFTQLDPYVYGICSGFNNFQQLRTTSPVLFAAICTVSALHDPHGQQVYEACNREFRRLVARSLFEKHDTEYVRALCICSFWLSDASRILSSDAIRRAADMRLHRSFEHLWVPSSSHLPLGTPPSTEVKDRVRLWYLIFISDEHLSILHNRDPLLRSDKEIATSWESYLKRDDASDSDVRLVSQVALLLIMSQVRDLLGSDQETRLPHVLVNQIVQSSRQLDKWFTKFSALFKPDPYIGDFPKRGLQLHYQFGKLYLGHQVFKGLNGEPIPSPFLTAASMAHDAAVAIFEMIMNEEPLQRSLVGMPHYFHIMIAFAGHFLLEVTKNYAVQLGIQPAHNFELIRKVLDRFRGTQCIAQHPIWRMTPGLERKLLDCMTSISGGNVHIDHGLSVMTSSEGMGYPARSAERPIHGPFTFPGDNLVNSMDDFLLTDLGEFTFPGMMSNGV